MKMLFYSDGSGGYVCVCVGRVVLQIIFTVKVISIET